MPLSYRIDPVAGLILIDGDGPITQAERLEALRTMFDDPDFRPGLNTLCDVSTAVSLPTMAEIREVVDVISRNSQAIGRKKMALVISNPTMFGVARQFVAMADQTPLQIQIFSTREAGLAWLQGRDA
jgi:hypothetical protein